MSLSNQPQYLSKLLRLSYAPGSSHLPSQLNPKTSLSHSLLENLSRTPVSSSKIFLPFLLQPPFSNLSIPKNISNGRASLPHYPAAARRNPLPTFACSWLSYTPLQLLSCSSTETHFLSNSQNISMPRVKLSLAPQFHYLTLWPPTTRRHVAPWDCDTCPKLAAENEPQMGVYNLVMETINQINSFRTPQIPVRTTLVRKVNLID